jgi:hypothetical protein
LQKFSTVCAIFREHVPKVCLFAKIDGTNVSKYPKKQVIWSNEFIENGSTPSQRAAA